MLKKLFVCIAVASMCLVVAGGADAKAPAQGSFKLYGAYTPTDESLAIPFGQLISSNACDGARKFKLLAVDRGAKSTTIDKGTTSRDGGVSAVIKSRDAHDAEDAVLVVAKTKKCAKVTFSFRRLGRDAAEQSFARPAGASIKFLSFAALSGDGVFVGTVSSSAHKCRSDRKIQLMLGDEVIDSGRTTADGSWALHFTEAEWFTPGWIRAVVSKTSECAGEKTKFNQSDLR